MIQVASKFVARLSVLLLAAPLLPAQAQSLQDFLKQAFEERLRERPEMATLIGRHEYDNRWDDWSKTGRDRVRTQTERLLSQLDRFSKMKLSGGTG